MTGYNIHNDDTDWLILVYKESGDDELMEEAREKLFSAGLDEKQIEERYQRIITEKNDEEAFEKAWKRQLESNANETYTLSEKIGIFFGGPFELFRNFHSGLIALRKENYKIKFRQRLILLVAGTVFWVLLFTGIFQYSQYRRMKEIGKVDISKWENNRIK